MADEHGIEARGLVRRFKDVEAVRGIDLRVEPAEIYLFLDEPTTGLDPQSRSALWNEVRRLAKDEGVTVFLTTQYLEEADVLADRVGIIDHGHLVAEGTPDQLKAQVGRSTVEAVPADNGQYGAVAAVLERFGTPTTGFRAGSVPG